jgi:aminodeoxyfutalosine deaminase
VPEAGAPSGVGVGVGKGGFGRELWTADVVYGGIGAAQGDGAVLVQRRPDGERSVIAVDTRARLAERAEGAEAGEHHPVLAPAPVNAHTHLDLSTMPFTPGSYEAFVARAIAHTRSGGRDGGRGIEAARRGIAALREAGTTHVGDIVTSEDVMRLLLDAPDLQGVAYWEVIGPDASEAEAILERTRAALQRFLGWQRPGGMRVGLSPHAPHTVSAPLLRGLTALARERALPLQIHVAESPGEAALHRHGDGPLRAALGPALIEWSASGLSPVGYLDSLGVLAARPTLVHMVHVDEDDARRVARAGCAVVHCPRSNEALECGTFPWTLFARHGVSVALGTDSLGSSPDLDVRREWEAAIRAHGAAANPAQLVWAAVKGGARALGERPPTVRRGDPLERLLGWSPVH